MPNPHQKSHFALLLLLNFCWIDKLVILKIQLSFDLKIKRQEHIPPLWFPHTQPAIPRWPHPHYSSPNVSLLLKIVDCCWTKTWNIRTAIYLMLMQRAQQTYGLSPTMFIFIEKFWFTLDISGTHQIRLLRPLQNDYLLSLLTHHIYPFLDARRGLR